jgi:hypothetical protein
LKGVAGVTDEAECTVVEHQDEVAWTGGEHRLGLVGASVALSHGGRHGVGGLGVSGEVAGLNHELGERLNELSRRIVWVDGEGFAAGYDFWADVGGLRESFAEAAGIGTGEIIADIRLGLGGGRLLTG